MSDPRIFLILGALFGFFQALKIKGVYSRVITWSCIASVSAMMVTIKEVSLDGYYLFGVTQIGIIVYTFSDSEFSLFKRAVLLISAVCTLLPMILFLGSSGIFNEIALLSGLIQIGVFSFALIKIIKELKEEIGFLVVLTSFALVHLVGGILFFLRT